MAYDTPDINEKLSSDFGTYLTGDSELDVIRDPLMPVLLRFREEYVKAQRNAGKSRVWDSLEKEISGTPKIHLLKKPSGLKYWAAAAAVVVASCIGIYYAFLSSTNELLLETFAQQAEITLRDGTEVVLRPYSRLTELKFSEGQQEYKLEGEGYFKVAKAENREFSVIAGDGIVTVLGTSFNLSSWGNISQVYLEEGSVRFSHVRSSSEVILEAGDAARTISGDVVQKDENAEKDVFTDWRNEQLVFSSKQLAFILAELEHHFNIKVSVPDSLNSVILSGGISLDSAEQSLNYLALTLDGKFELIRDKEYRFIPSTE